MKRVSSKVFIMQKTRRKRCPECGFLSTQKCGKRNGHQRYKCSNCGVILLLEGRMSLNKIGSFGLNGGYFASKQLLK